MRINITNRGILEIEDARIVYRNFSGIKSQFNREGLKGFSVVIPNQEICDQLVEAGWNVKIKPPRDEDDRPFMHLPVKVRFNGRGPAAYIQSAGNVTRLNEETIGMIDDIDIASVDMDLRPYDWEVNGNNGRTAYLQAINVIQNIDRFGAKYMEDDMPF